MKLLTDENKRIGISDDRIKHMLGVARKCYELACADGETSEAIARGCFVMGLLHDCGYEFVEEKSDHPDMSEEICRQAGMTHEQILNAIKWHGKPECPDDSDSWYLMILNKADMMIDSKGNCVSPENRLLDIKYRFGENSTEYMDALKIYDCYFKV